jgi:hypothetical protein
MDTSGVSEEQQVRSLISFFGQLHWRLFAGLDDYGMISTKDHVVA